jgi:hypothetical protein
VLPALTDAGPVSVTERSAVSGMIFVVIESLLLARFGSLVVLVTETALVTVEPAGTEVGIVHVTTNESVLPEAIAALAVSVKIGPPAVKLSGSLAAGTMLKLLAVNVPVGVSKFSASVKTTPEAGSGPRLLRVIS